MNSRSSSTDAEGDKHVKELKTRMSLEVLKRQDSTIVSIIHTFEHAVMYKYTNDEWVT
jgi:hypothetical protein